MSEEKDNESPGGSWRTIRQDVTARAMSKRGRQRQLLAWTKVVALVVLVGGGLFGIYSVVHTWESDRAAIATAVRSEPVREIVVLTNGVLTREWVAKTVALPRETTLMALDLAALREKLMASGQVSVAVLTRNFPDTLVVNLQERTPVARLQVSDGLGNRQLLVAKDGVVYDGAGYEKSLVATLPWLAGFSLRRGPTPGSYEPIEGMESVASLLTTAQLQAPNLYRTWLIVSLERLRSHQELTVKSEEIPEIIFSAKDDFFRQIAQLDYIVDTTRPQSGQVGLQSVNLALGRDVPVRFTQTPDELAKQPAAAGAPVFNLQPSSSRKTKRDL
jgi:cell division protein FtsQ